MKTVRRGSKRGGTEAEFVARMREITRTPIKKTVKKVQGLKLNSWKSPKPTITETDIFLP